MKRIKDTSPTQPRIRDTSPLQPRVDPLMVARALGAEVIGTVPKGLNPMAFAALRQDLFRRLVSTGGRPSLEGVDRRQKVPISDEDWKRLRRLAARLATPTQRPAPAQVASALLHLALANLDDAESALRDDSESKP